MTRWAASETRKNIPARPPREHMPASVGLTLGMLFVILVVFALLVIWYMR